MPSREQSENIERSRVNEVSGQNDFSSRSKIRPVLCERVNLRGQNKSGALFKPTTI